MTDWRVFSIALGFILQPNLRKQCFTQLTSSSFWQSDRLEQSPKQTQDWIVKSSFLALASINSKGQADVSPKGDPAGLLIQQSGEQLYFADRPGNRRIDSFRNILEQPQISLMALIPGSNNILTLQGTAAMIAEDQLLEGFAVKGKKPKLATQITPSSMEIRPSAAIEKAELWKAKPKPQDLKPADIFKAHVKQSKDSSLTAKIARTALSVPGAMEKGLEADYKKNMY